MPLFVYAKYSNKRGNFIFEINKFSSGINNIKKLNKIIIIIIVGKVICVNCFP